MIIKIKDYCAVEKGETGIQKAIKGEYPLVVTAEERLSSDSYQFDREAVCIPMVSSTGHGHASLNRVHFQEGKFALGNILCAVYSLNENIILTKYLYVYFSINKDTVLVPLMKGSANVALSLTSIKNIEIDVPTIERQEEIIEKYNEIFENYNDLSIKISKLLDKVNLAYSKIMNDCISNVVLVKMIELFNVEKGKLQSSKAIDGTYHFLTASEEWKTHNKYEYDCEALVFAMGASGSLGRTHYVNDKFIASDLCFVLTKKNKCIDLPFYKHLFMHLREKVVKDLARGSAKKAINGTNFKEYMFPFIEKSVSDNILLQLDELKNIEFKLKTIKNSSEQMFIKKNNILMSTK